MSDHPRNTTDDSWQAASSVAAVVENVFGDSAVRVRPDGLVHIDVPDGRSFLAELLPRVSRPAVLQSWERLQRQAESVDAIPLLVVSHLPRSLRDLVESEDINWVDLAGNAAIQAPPLLVHIEGKRRRRTTLSSGIDPFAPRSANIVRHLLADPQRTWRQKELVLKTGLSQSRTSKVLAALQELALVRADDEGLHVADPEGLLDAWADARDYRRQEIVPVHLSGEGIGMARALDEKLEQIDVTHWFTGLPAAWAYDHFARFRLVSVYVDGDPEFVRRAAGLRAVERGANIHLIASGVQRLEIGQNEPEGLRCVHPAQVYVDLLALPERAQEAAEHLKPLALAGPQP